MRDRAARLVALLRRHGICRHYRAYTDRPRRWEARHTRDAHGGTGRNLVAGTPAGGIMVDYSDRHWCASATVFGHGVAVGWVTRRPVPFGDAR